MYKMTTCSYRDGHSGREIDDFEPFIQFDSGLLIQHLLKPLIVNNRIAQNGRNIALDCCCVQNFDRI